MFTDTATSGLDFLWNDTAESPTVTLPTSDRPRRAQYEEGQVKDKISNCGRVWKKFFSAETGRRQAKPYLCRIFHSEHGHCERCLQQRATELTKRILLADKHAEAQGQHIYCVDLPTSKRNSIARKYGKKNYLACPLSDDILRIFYQSASADGIEYAFLVNKHTPYEFWVETAKSPIGKNLSGNLGKIEPTKGEGDETPATEKEEPVKIKVTEVVVEGLSREDDEEAVLTAYMQTVDAQPKTAAQVQDVLAKRTQTYVREAVKRGGVLKHIEASYHKVLLSKLRWDSGDELLASQIEPRYDAPSVWETRR